MNTKNGFTLIELLVVVAIIGILAGVVLVSLNSARAKARDTQRIASIKQVQNALELYHTANGAYPVPPSTSPDGLVSNCIEETAGNTFNDGFAQMMAPYIPSLPTDPRGGSWPYCWFYTPINYYYCPQMDPGNYTIIFTTEHEQYEFGTPYGIQGEVGSAKRYCVQP